MDYLLFSSRSIWTMIHGIVLGGAAVVAVAIALFSLRAMSATDSDPLNPTTQRQAKYLGWLTATAATVLWMTVLVGTYITFPPYRATPPEGTGDLAQYPRSLIQSSPDTAWLHSFAMEIKEHVPWIAAILATAVAFLALRYRSKLLTDAQLNRMASVLLAICFALTAGVALLGIFINKLAPLE